VSSSLFTPATMIQNAKDNAEKHDWAREAQAQFVKNADPWMGFSDDELWDLMFGSTIMRSWMVWSNGHCPACEEGVPMYNWEIDALNRPWKLGCPHCKELFPKNDFYAYYKSGLDPQGVFQHKLGDRSLLFNEEHPDKDDPLHLFGVDDGNGYRKGDNIWWYIGTYLVYGQWKQVVLGGIINLSAAYAVTGEEAYSHKAGVLLDRVADLYTTFDFKNQAMMYEGPAHAGYVSTWHDACEEARQLAQAYDQVRDGLGEEQALADFLSNKAAEHNIETLKDSSKDVMKNIEEGILRDTITNHDRIRSNYPRKEIALVTIHSVLDWPNNREQVYELIDELMEQATAVDGVTGEKGLSGYCSGVIQSLAVFLERFCRVDENFLSEMLERHPRLKETYRFHIDMWCLQQYYPQAGDTGSYATKVDRYVGVPFSNNPGLDPSMYTFLWHMYEETKDVAYVQALYQSNGGTVDGLPYGLFAEDPAEFQKKVQAVIDVEGTQIRLNSVNKEEWRLAILRSGEGANRRAVWIDYDSGGAHGHLDGMNLGLFAKGLDLMPDFGYPPVHFGGWSGPKFHWYVSTAGHNTVVVDGQDQERRAGGETTLWGEGEDFQAIRVSGKELYKLAHYERTVVSVDVSKEDGYILDLFRVVGGSDHAKFMHSHFGSLSTEGLSLKPGEEFGFETQMRNFSVDPAAKPGWQADWKVEDRYGYLEGKRDIHLRYTDLTIGAEAHTAEAWVALHGYGGNETDWIPRLMVRRKGDRDLSSTFAGVIEAYEDSSAVSSIRRLDLEQSDGKPCSDSDVAVEIVLADGRKDLIVALDADNPSNLVHALVVQKDWDAHFEAQMCWVRKNADDSVEKIVLCKGKSVQVGGHALILKSETDFVEIRYEGENPVVVAGAGEMV
jgi:hypothetical protein